MATKKKKAGKGKKDSAPKSERGEQKPGKKGKLGLISSGTYKY